MKRHDYLKTLNTEQTYHPTHIVKSDNDSNKSNVSENKPINFSNVSIAQTNRNEHTIDTILRVTRSTPTQRMEQESDNFEFMENLSEIADNLTENDKRDRIERVARIYGLNTKGRKCDLIKRIRDYRTDESTIWTVADDASTKAQIDWVANSNSYKKLTRWGIVRMTGSMSNGRAFSCGNSCWSIKNSGFRDEMFYDLSQEVFIALQNAITAGDVRIFNGWFTLADSAKGVLSDNYVYVLTMRTIQQYLSDNKLTVNNKAYTNRGILAEALSYIDNSQTADIELRELYAQLHGFYAYLHKMGKWYRNFAENYVDLWMAGYTVAEIAVANDLDEDICKYRIRRIRELYSIYKKEGEIVEEYNYRHAKSPKTMSVVSKSGTTYKVVDTLSDFIIPSVKYSLKKVETPTIDRTDRQMKQYMYENLFFLTAHDRKQLELDKVFGIGGLMDTIEATKAEDEYIRQNINNSSVKKTIKIVDGKVEDATIQEVIHYYRKDDYIVAEYPDGTTHRYAIQKNTK